MLARSRQPSSDYYRLGVEAVTRTLADGVDDICRQAGIPAGAIAFTWSGCPATAKSVPTGPTLDAVPLAVLGHDRYLCVNDMVCGWAGSLGATDGINVVGGTGSMTYGERRGVGCPRRRLGRALRR